VGTIDELEAIERKKNLKSPTTGVGSGPLHPDKSARLNDTQPEAQLKPYLQSCGGYELDESVRSGCGGKVGFKLETVVELRSAPGSVERAQDVIHNEQRCRCAGNVVEVVRLPAHR